MRRAGVVGCAGIAAVAASSPAPAETERPDGTRGCRARIEGPGGIKFHLKHDLRVGPVVFFGLRLAAKGPLTEYRGRDPSWKSAIAVRAGAPVLLRVPPEARGDITLTYAVDRNGTPRDVR